MPPCRDQQGRVRPERGADTRRSEMPETGSRTATGIVRPALRSYLMTWGAFASTVSRHIVSRSSPKSSRAVTSNCRSRTWTCALDAFRRFSNQSGSLRDPEPVPHTTRPSDVLRKRTHAERGMPVRLPGVVMSKTCASLRPLDRRPSKRRYTHAAIRLPVRVQLRLRPTANDAVTR